MSVYYAFRLPFLLLMLSSFVHHGGLLAQTLPTAQGANSPDAGRILRDAQNSFAPDVEPKEVPSIQHPVAENGRPAQSSPDDALVRKIDVTRFVIQGMSKQSGIQEDTLLALVADGQGKRLSFTELNALANRITNHYASLGYDLALAFLPAQEIQDGVVTLAVVEGVVGKVSVENSTKYPLATAEQALQSLRPGDVVRRQNLEQHLLLLTDVPGVDVSGVLRAGGKPGETDIVVKLRPATALRNAVDFDNFGSKSTGIYRMGISMAIPSARTLGEQLSVRAVTTGSGMNLANVAWQIPLGGLSDKLTLSATTLRYKLGDAFQYLNATGTANSVSANWTHIFARNYQSGLYGSFDLTRRMLHDNKETPFLQTSKSANVITVSLNGYVNGEGRLANALAYGLSLTAGNTKLDSTDSTAGAPQGSFNHINSHLSYQIPMSGRWSAMLSGYSQHATQNQDSSERLSLGGPTGVRAYPSGEGAGDRGVVASAELRYLLTNTWQLSSFYDTGFSTVQANPASTALNQRHLAGAGIGVQYSLPRAARLRTSLAWRVTDDAAQLDADRKPRVWVSGVIYF